MTPSVSLVVCCYNMARELPRTVRSLSPAMQRGIQSSDYEIIVVDYGSTEPFDERACRQWGADVRVIRIPREVASQSPAEAMNLGIAQAQGALVGAIIDGARMASPALLSRAVAAARLHTRPMIGTIAFHLGPAAQMQSVQRGYDQSVEDKLLGQSGWEADPYSLFSMSALAGSSAGGWFELPAECNALFLRADHWRELGYFDTRFKSPGGGLVNLDMWSRVCADQTGELIMLLGEATFHQFHGGVSTNNPVDPFEQFHEEYVRIRGASYRRPTRKPLYFGSLSGAVRSTLKQPMIQVR